MVPTTRYDRHPGGTVQHILALSHSPVIVPHWFEIDLDDASMEHGARIELRELSSQPHRGSESAAQLITADRPLWRADLFDRLTDVPGSFGVAHYHPGFSGNEPSPRAWDPELTAEPWRWLHDQIANLGEGPSRKAWPLGPGDAEELLGLADAIVTLARELGPDRCRSASQCFALTRDARQSVRLMVGYLRRPDLLDVDRVSPWMAADERLPSAMPLPGWPGQRGRGQEVRRALEVQRVQRVVGRRVATGERRQVPLSLDELEDGGVVVDRAGHVPRPGVRGNDHRRHPEPETVIRGRPGVGCIDQLGVAGEAEQPERENALHGIWAGPPVGLGRAGGGDVFVVPAVLVIQPDQQRLGPSPPGHDGVDDLGRESLADLDILRVLLRVAAEVRIDDAHRRQLACPGGLPELRDGPQVVHRAQEPQRVQVGRGLHLAHQGRDQLREQRHEQGTKGTQVIEPPRM